MFNFEFLHDSSFDDLIEQHRQRVARALGVDPDAKPEHDAYNILEDIAMFSKVPLSRVEEIWDMIQEIDQNDKEVLSTLKNVRALKRQMRDENEVRVLFAFYGRLLHHYTVMSARVDNIRTIRKMWLVLKLVHREDGVPLPIFQKILEKVLGASLDPTEE